MNLRHLDLTQLAYLRAVARSGSVTGAAAALSVAPQTVSGQLGVLEERLGVPLLERAGRGVRLTDAGRLVLEYASEMLSRGEDLLRALEGAAGQPTSFAIGVDEIVPKLVARRFLEPVLALEPAPRLVCREGNETALMADLRARRLDAVLVPGPPTDLQGLQVTLLATSAIGVYGTPPLARRIRPRFPASLAGAPLLLPGAAREARRLVEGWLASRDLRPHVVGEFDDAALREAFGAIGAGLLLAPELIGPTLRKVYGVERIGTLPELKARYFLVAPERRHRPPAQAAIEALAEAS
ncbi:MAG: LysR family transcriptional regulator [Steroidobacteraceae bacterium]|nr:LysR family transcriptional regulator [Steroidobacteraceae bacterium]